MMSTIGFRQGRARTFEREEVAFSDPFANLAGGPNASKALASRAFEVGYDELVKYVWPRDGRVQAP